MERLDVRVDVLRHQQRGVQQHPARDSLSDNETKEGHRVHQKEGMQGRRSLGVHSRNGGGRVRRGRAARHVPVRWDGPSTSPRVVLLMACTSHACVSLARRASCHRSLPSADQAKRG